MSIALKSLELTGLFEAEVLVELMLRYWQHPLANDREFRNDLLERTAEVLKQAVDGVKAMEDVAPENTNFVGASWYAEWVALQGLPSEAAEERQRWLDGVRHAMPSCFCNPEDLRP